MAGHGENAPIIVKKVVAGHGGHHGGGWKVAYADFVTAMMAFFLLLWLLNVTTSEQRKGIADYFAPTAASLSKSGSGGVLGGSTLSSEGARNSELSPPVVTVEVGDPDEESEQDEGQPSSGRASEKELARELAERERQMFEEAERALRQAIQETPDMPDLSQNLIIDNTPEGLRIQIVDQERQSMFPSGSAALHGRMSELMARIADVVLRLPNRVSITGHTDATPFRTDSGYGNWELSADRANASRRALIEFGLPAERIAFVTGKADTEPLIPEDPTLAANRRISVVLLRETSVLPPGGGQ